MKRKLISLVMAVVLSIGMFTTVSAEPVDNGDAVVVEETGAGSIESDDVTVLPVPKNLRWSNNFDPQWDVVPEAHGHYIIEIYKDGALYDTRYWSLGDIEKEFEEICYSPDINESGSYSFRVKSNNSWDTETTVPSEFSEMSEIKVYVRPDAVLGTTVGFWDTEKEGTFCYYGVENAGGYKLHFYRVMEDGTYREDGASWYVGNTNYDTTTNLHKEDLTYRITQEGKYAVAVQALSADVSTIANGVEGEKSAVFDTTATSDKVEETLKDVLENKTADEALTTVKAEYTVDELRTAMQTDEEVLGLMEDLETKYLQAHPDIQVEQSVDEEVEALGVDADKVSMIGAALNIGAGDVTLEMKVAAEKVDVDTNRYKNSVQLDLKLNTEVGYKSNLEVPITITMPIPTGIDVSKLTILHYCQDGTEEVVHPKNNGDGTITFTVTKFSTFVFAEDHGTGNNDGGPGGYEENPSDTTPVVSPKTDDSSMGLTVVLFAIAAVAAVAGMVASRKENMSR